MRSIQPLTNSCSAKNESGAWAITSTSALPMPTTSNRASPWSISSRPTVTAGDATGSTLRARTFGIAVPNGADRLGSGRYAPTRDAHELRAIRSPRSLPAAAAHRSVALRARTRAGPRGFDLPWPDRDRPDNHAADRRSRAQRDRARHRFGGVRRRTGAVAVG